MRHHCACFGCPYTSSTRFYAPPPSSVVTEHSHHTMLLLPMGSTHRLAFSAPPSVAHPKRSRPLRSQPTSVLEPKAPLNSVAQIDYGHQLTGPPLAEDAPCTRDADSFPPACLPNVHYKRVMLKVSGEALQGNSDFGIDPNMLTAVAEQVSGRG